MKKTVKLLLVVFLLAIICSIYSNESLATSTLDCSTTLRSGSKGSNVIQLQSELNTIMDCGLALDGSFGTATKNCVFSFQKKYSLSQDAIVGPNTCKVLNKEYLEKIGMNEQPEENTDLVCSSTNNLKVGSKGKQVEYLQEKLNETMGCGLSVDGSFGNATKKCVINFQSRMGLTKDGVVGTTTCSILKEVYDNRNNPKFTIQGNEQSLDCHYSLKRGSSGSNVKQLQKELNKVTDCNLVEDGSFGSGTLACVKKYQKSKGLTVDGSVGASTCRNLNVDYLASNNYVVSSSVTPIRLSNSSSSEIIATATYGTVFKNYDQVGDWYKIKYNNTYAYINKNDVTIDAIVVDISNQNMKLYQNGKLGMDSLIITGLKGVNDTPQGAYTLNVSGKHKNIKLIGDDYESPVSYWMPFIGSSYGFHDADAWRSNGQFYDKTRYTYNGSHGCINMLDEDARLLYNKVTVNTPVYIYE